MSSCETFRELLVFHAEGVLAPESIRQVEEHLASCAACRQESEQIGRIRGWLKEPELFEPEQDLAWELLPGKLAGRAASLPSRRWNLAGLGLPQWAMGAAAIAALACGLIWMMRLHVPRPPAAAIGLAGSGNAAFLDRVHTVYTREATVQYLDGCHALLLDLASTARKCDRNHFDVSLEIARARQLLQQKRMIDAGPSVPNLEQARSLCDDLERFLVNLSTSRECESGDALQLMERSIERGQLLLRIHVVSSDIS